MSKQIALRGRRGLHRPPHLQRPDPHLDDERRRYYRITRYGRKAARAEAARMGELVQLAAATFGVPGHA